MIENPKLAELRHRLAEISDLQHAEAVLGWDQLVMMPRSGAPARAHQLATLHAIAHDRFIDPGLGELLDELEEYAASLPYDSDDASLIRVTRRDWDKAVRVPTELTAAMVQLASEAVEAWTAAREADDYDAFRPWLDRTLELRARYQACFEPVDDPYDVHLDDFEPGMKTAQVRAVFDRIRPALQELTVQGARDVVEPFESAHYPAGRQHELSLQLMRAFGADDAFRLDTTVHPFCTSFAIADIRLTTRYAEDDLHGNSIFSTMHEAGHGLYERGVSATLERTPLASGCSSALHESQSRLWENVIGRSLPFWRWFYPHMQAAFPKPLGGVSLERFHRAVNGVRRSLVRVDADEVTYGLHIILRFELEEQLLSGTLSTADVPEAWNTRFEELVGVPVPNDRLGCLQDVHWSGGSFGYFPTYQLGNVISSQIWARLLEDVPDAEEQIERGSFEEIHGWLRDHLYALGRKLTPQETLERVVGGPIDPEPYVDYLRAKVDSLSAV
ncbi:MAG: carboxypeptidase M32 [Thermoleophilia bacterium]|nr:carboxypeptidase M32 [Thermoleophilia bacterium]MDH4345604.1 carboxypeptidase M32 [Thermoleophilia bacterium]